MQKGSINEIQETAEGKTDHTLPISNDFFQNKLQPANSQHHSQSISPNFQPKEIAKLTLSSFVKNLADNTTKFRKTEKGESNLITIISTISAYNSNFLLKNNRKKDEKQIEDVKQKYILERVKDSFETSYLTFLEKEKFFDKDYLADNNPYYANPSNAASENAEYVFLEQVVFNELKNENYLLGTDGVSTCLALLFFGASQSKKFGATAHLTYLQIKQLPFVIATIKNGFITHGAELTHAAMLGGDIENIEDEMKYAYGKNLFLSNLQDLESRNIFYKKPNKNLKIYRENKIDNLSSNNNFGEDPALDGWVTLNGFKYKDYNITDS